MLLAGAAKPGIKGDWTTEKNPLGALMGATMGAVAGLAAEGVASAELAKVDIGSFVTINNIEDLTRRALDGRAAGQPPLP